MEDKPIEQNRQQLTYCADRGIDTRPLTLSFRDQCAIAAMPLVFEKRPDRSISEQIEAIAKWSFELADAMEAERAKRATK